MNSVVTIEDAIIVASHRRSGTHLTLDTLVNNFSELSGGFGNLDRIHDESNVAERRLFKTHSHGQFRRFSENIDLRLGSNLKCIYVVRDGRDVMTSLFHYMKAFDDSVKSVDFDTFIRMQNRFDHETVDQELSRVAYWRWHVDSWIEQTEFPVLFVTFEDWIQHYDETLERVASYLGYNVRRERVVDLRRNKKPSYWNRAISRVSRRLFGRSKETSIGFRSGRVGGWKEEFNESSLSFYDSETVGLSERMSAVNSAKTCGTP